ncbi:hypothetical protein [Flavobacterium sp. YO64]|uniref:hypothetical protein n=1 Tax=Flavobacterium sp. YO64 TaxID=394559 RepID=UPI00100A2C77|nr:hypothetical protein [Flavobacterium sp. YO64]RXM46226.1 hypothetical protein BOW57_03785 [Flavobacterium sp. YO64]
MKYYFIFLFFTIFKCFGQDISEINKALEIPDTLEFKQEIRIYKDYSVTNGMEIFRMYDEGKDNWKVYIFSFDKASKAVTKINAIQFPKESIRKLNPVNPNLIWLNILLCDVEFLPNFKNIDYKLKVAKIIAEDGEFGISQNKKHVLDGESYRVFVKNGNNENNFSFDNPAFYLKYYPTVDELISYNELLSIIKKEFNLWED